MQNQLVRTATRSATIVILLTAVTLVASPAIAASFSHTATFTDPASTAIQSVDPARTFSSNSSAFDLTYGADLTANPLAQAAFDRAASTWASYLNDPITINLDLNYAPLGDGILGQTSTSMLYGDYDTVRNLVSANYGETNDARQAALLPALPTAAKFSAYVPEGFDLDGNMTISQANYHALGGTGFTGSDGSITFSSNFNWDFDRTDGITAGHFDFEGVAVHEIGHALGFVSEVDYVDWIYAADDTAQNIWPTTLDLFRFKTEDLASPDFDFTNTPRNLVPGGRHAFFTGDGDDAIALATGSYAGDGSQASHWKDMLGIGIMDPTAAPGELIDISINDLIALDLIGWDINYNVPEPATMLLLTIGSLMTIKRRPKHN